MLRDLSGKRSESDVADSDAFYNPEFDRTNLQNVDVMTDAASTVAGTTFTRYTMAPSATSKKSKWVTSGQGITLTDELFSEEVPRLAERLQ